MNTSSDRMTLCTVRVDNQQYAFDMLAIREANQATPCVRVPGAPTEVLGMVNLRGSLFLLLDIRLLLGLPTREPAPQDLLVVFRPSQGEAFGVLVDSLDDAMVVPIRKITPRAENDANDPSPICGVILNEHQPIPLLSPSLMYRRVKNLIGTRAPLEKHS